MDLAAMYVSSWSLWDKVSAQHRVKTKNIKNHAQLGLPDKGREIKELVVFTLPFSIPWAIERVTLQYTFRICSRWHGEDLYLKRHLAPKRSKPMEVKEDLNPNKQIFYFNF